MDCGHSSPEHIFPPPLSNLNWSISGELSSPANSLMPFPAEPGFAERAARYSCFAGEDSSVTETNSGNAKKRKAPPPKRKAKDKDEQSDDGAKVLEPFKDYIHVRARRGQATDSHSLAERVRREKISQRMKLLQDLVPGCNKITGKALMLDEIINYVQALQRQVEFLSMKLASVNPGLDFNLEHLISKESFVNQANASFSSSLNPLETLASSMPFSLPNGFDSYCSIDSIIHQAAMMQSSLDMFGASVSQVENFWDDEYHGVLQPNYGQNQENGIISQSIHGKFPIAHMKIEL